MSYMKPGLNPDAVEGMDMILNGANRHKRSQLLRERSPI